MAGGLIWMEGVVFVLLTCCVRLAVCERLSCWTNAVAFCSVWFSITGAVLDELLWLSVVFVSITVTFEELTETFDAVPVEFNSVPFSAWPVLLPEIFVPSEELPVWFSITGAVPDELLWLSVVFVDKFSIG